MAKDAMKRIADAEDKAAETEERAKVQCNTIAKEAALRAEGILEDARIKGKELIEARLEVAEKATADIKQKAEEDAENQAAALRKSALNSYEKAVNMVIDTVLN